MGYPAVVDMGAFGYGTHTTECELQKLLADGWLGTPTELLNVELSVINPTLHMIGTVTMSFEFHIGTTAGCHC